MMNNMDMKYKSKKGLSLVISTLLIILLVLLATAIVWRVVTKMINSQIDESEACFGIFDKVKLNLEYTCYNSTSKELQFSIDLGDVEVDSVLVSVFTKEKSKSFEITTEETQIENLKNYDGSNNIKLPEKNAGLTYFYDLSGAGFSEWPKNIEIAPIVNKNQCEVSDSLNEIDDCVIFNN